MKKVLLIAVIALLSLSNVNAQDVKFGAKTGLNLSDFKGDLDNVEAKIGFNIGAFVEIGLSDKFTFQPELLFSTQGAKSEGSEGSDSFERTIKANYLNVPLMLKYAVSDKFALEFGPQIGFLLSADIEGTQTFDGNTVTINEDFKDSLKSIDFGLNFGASFDIVENVFIGARYNLGLSNIIDSEDMDSDDEKAQNSVFSVSVGYRF